MRVFSINSTSRALSIIFAATLILGVAMLPAVAGNALAAPLAPAGDMTLETLQNLEYISAHVEDGAVTLTGGAFKAASTSGSDEGVSVALGHVVAFGDLTGDGAQDAAAVLLTTTGGSGTFVDLAAVVQEQGTPRNVAVKALGAGTQVESIAIEGDRIVVNMVTLGPDDPQCCPTLEVARSYRIVGNKLVATGPLFPYTDGSAYGYVDVSGAWAIDPQWQAAGEFVDGLARVTANDLQGFIDPSGQYVVEPHYRYAQDFSDGLALVDQAEPAAERSQFAFIDNLGNQVIDASQYVAAADFSEGLAGVTNGAKFGFIDKTGELVIPLEFDFAGRFSEGLAAVTVDGKTGFIDPKGNIVIEPQFNFVNDFSDGLAAVSGEAKMGYVDSDGEWAIKPAFDQAFDFAEGLAFVISGDKNGYVDKTGKMVVEGDFGFGYKFSDGLAAVDIQGLYGYVDASGKQVIEPKFVQAGPFHDGIALVTTENAWGGIDPDGNMVFELPVASILSGPLPTDVIWFLPSVPKETRKGECPSASVLLPLPTAFRCTVDKETFDPCLLADDAQTIVCGMDPYGGQPGFALELTQPLPQPKETGGAGAEAQSSGLTKKDLDNAKYDTEWTSSGVAQLKDGSYEEKSEDSATGLYIALTDMVAYGDLDGDGEQDAVAIMGTNGGGSGTFMDLVAILDKNGKPIHAATTALGDRVVINGLSIRNGVISVDMFTHGPNDGMCCPTVPIIFSFKLDGNRLVQVGDTPWLLQLTDGAKCQLSSESTLEFEGKRVNYQCDNGASLLGDVMAGVPWTATQGIVAKAAGTLVISDTRTVDMAIVWQPVDPNQVIAEVGLVPDQVTVDPGTVAASVSGHIRPGLDFNPNAIPDLNGDPPHLRLTFDGQVLPNWTAVYPELPQILVFPVELYETMYRRIGLYDLEQQIDNLRSVTEEQPATIDVTIPLMPAIPAAQTFTAQVKYLEFEGGQGVRFITHYAQDASPITNDRIFYTFQGLTDDGKYLVSVYHPISTALLPDDYEAANVDDNYDVFVQNFDSYLQHTVLAMDESKSADFSPSLDELDAMVQSIKVGE